MRILLFLILITFDCRADKWVLPTEMAAISENGRYVVRITPGDNFAELVGFEGANKGKNAYLKVYKYNEPSNSYQFENQFSLKNPIAPLDVYISNSGMIITTDNWSNVGYGDVLVVYKTNGNAIRHWHFFKHDFSDTAQVPCRQYPETRRRNWIGC